MGYGYELKCKKCGREKPIFLGIGFRYPRVCATILEEMKDGKFGKRFMEDAKNTPFAAVHQERAIFICDNCGKWRSDEVIDLCAPIGEPEQHNGRFCVAIEYPDGIPYVMTSDIGRKYRIIRSKQHRCSKCRHKLRLIRKNEKLRCPECSELLKRVDEFNWD